MGTAIEIPFRAPATEGAAFIEATQIEVLDFEGFRVTVEIPSTAWAAIKRIARASGEDPRERLFTLAAKAHKRSSSTSSASMTISRSRVSI